jgi:hypothetical protein
MEYPARPRECQREHELERAARHTEEVAKVGMDRLEEKRVKFTKRSDLLWRVALDDTVSDDGCEGNGSLAEVK